MIGTAPAELVWFVSDASEAYDVMAYRAMAAEYYLAEAFSGRTWAGLWVSDRHLDGRWRPFERAAAALLGAASPFTPNHSWTLETADVC